MDFDIRTPLYSVTVKVMINNLSAHHSSILDSLREQSAVACMTICPNIHKACVRDGYGVYLLEFIDCGDEYSSSRYVQRDSLSTS